MCVCLHGYVFEQGNHTSFIPTCSGASGARNALQALFQLGPGNYEEMMGVLFDKDGLAGERLAHVSNACRFDI